MQSGRCAEISSIIVEDDPKMDQRKINGGVDMDVVSCKSHFSFATDADCFLLSRNTLYFCWVVFAGR